MPPALALVLTLLFIAVLFVRDYRERYAPSLPMLVPCLWVFLRCSRSVTEWTGILLGLGPPMGGGDIEDGTPIDRAVLFILMGAGLSILLHRGISWSNVVRSNLALWMFFLYCGVSLIWSDLPFVGFKRWIKAFGDPIMVLVILTDRHPLWAVEVMFRSTVNLVVPVSVLFIKYYPHLGRTYSEWTGAAAYTGVTTNKNLLGFVLMVSGLSLVWRLYRSWGSKVGNKIDNLLIPMTLFIMVMWLFTMADSKTSLIGFLVGVALFFVLGSSRIRRYISIYLIIGTISFAVLQSTINITDLIITSAGRDATLTGRTEVWEAVLLMQQHPVLGFGFESFWLGERLKMLQDRWYFRPNQAHSGYIELYLNLGWVGWIFFAAVILSCYWKLRKLLTLGSHRDEGVIFGRLGMAYLFTYLVYNYTEAAFKSPHLLFIVFLLFAIKYVPRQAMIKNAASSWPIENPHPLAGIGPMVPFRREPVRQ